MTRTMSTSYEVQFDIDTTDDPIGHRFWFPDADPWASSAAFETIDEAREGAHTLIARTPGLHARIIATTVETTTAVVEDFSP